MNISILSLVLGFVLSSCNFLAKDGSDFDKDNAANLKRPGMVALMSVVPGDGQVTVQWSQSLRAQSYRLSYKLQSSTYWSIAAEFAGNTYTITSLINGSDYDLKVTALNAAGKSESPIVSIKP
jgi:hypothetical protein